MMTTTPIMYDRDAKVWQSYRPGTHCLACGWYGETEMLAGPCPECGERVDTIAIYWT